jgi:fructose/tagatose bisphosphate aldolase
MTQTTVQQILDQLSGTLHLDGRRVFVDANAFQTGPIDILINLAVFGTEEEKAIARWLIWESALEIGIYPASIHELYIARGRGETPVNFTVPAMNLRAMTYDLARSAFEAAVALNVGAMIFEISRGEMQYTAQRPAEYVASVLAGAIKAGFRGPVYIQGDHFQVSHKNFLKDPQAEVQMVKDLSAEAIAAGYYNIDIDTSTLVDLSKADLSEQQYLNAHHCAEITDYIRSIQPEGVEISLGGEIGEVGEKNSTVEELHAFMKLYLEELAKLGDMAGISKISVQTGTSHGGVVLADGTIADVSVDFDTLELLSNVSRADYGLAGAVQHGASTLPEAAFGKFAESTACEIHLATGFMNMLYEHPAFPAPLKQEMYAWIDQYHADSRGNQTPEQFYYKERKRAIGTFKPQLWGLDETTRAAFRESWQARFSFLFQKLNVVNTIDLAVQFTTPVLVHKSLSDFGIVEVAEEDVSDLAD